MVDGDGERGGSTGGLDGDDVYRGVCSDACEGGRDGFDLCSELPICPWSTV